VQAISSLRAVLRFRRFERDAARRRLASAASVADLRRIAKRRLPAGSSTTSTAQPRTSGRWRATRRRFADIEFHPRACVTCPTFASERRCSAAPLAFPLLLCRPGSPASPTRRRTGGRSRRRGPASPTRLDLVDTVDRGGCRRRARRTQLVPGLRLARPRARRGTPSAGERGTHEAIVITVDTPVHGRRERDVRRGFTLPQRSTGDLLDGILHPRWSYDLVHNEPITFANLTGLGVGDGSSAVTLAEYINAHSTRACSWKRPRVVPRPVVGPDRAEGHCERRRRRARPGGGIDAIRALQSRRPPARRRPAADRARRAGARCHRRQVPVLVTAGCDAGATSPRPSPSARRPAWRDGLPLRSRAAGETGVDFVLSLLADGMRNTMACSGGDRRRARPRPPHLPTPAASAVDADASSPHERGLRG